MAEEFIPQDEAGPYAENGVDVTMIRWMLSLAPLERLQVLQQFINAIEGFRDGSGPE